LGQTIAYFIAPCYHSSKPRYCSDDFVKELCCTIDQIDNSEPDPVFLITGDFNSLCTDFLEEDCGFTQMVHSSTHGNNILDKVFCNRPDLFHADVHKSLIKTKHLITINHNHNEVFV